MQDRQYYVRDPNGIEDEMTVRELSELFTSWSSWLGFLRLALTGEPCTMTAWMGSHPLVYHVQATPFPGREPKPGGG